MRGNETRAARSPTAGVTLLETLIGMAFFAVAALSVMHVMIHSLRLDAVNRETAVAMLAARRVIHQMRATPFDQVFAEFNADPKDDPTGEGLAHGSACAVPDLPEYDDVVLAPRGEIVFPVADNGDLREDLDMPLLSLPRDLSGDGQIDGKDHRDDIVALPVLVQVRWTGTAGPRRVELHAVLRR